MISEYSKGRYSMFLYLFMSIVTTPNCKYIEGNCAFVCFAIFSSQLQKHNIHVHCIISVSYIVCIIAALANKIKQLARAEQCD